MSEIVVVFVGRLVVDLAAVQRSYNVLLLRYAGVRFGLYLHVVDRVRLQVIDLQKRRIFVGPRVVQLLVQDGPAMRLVL